MLDTVKSYTRRISYFGRKEWNGTGEAINFNKGIGGEHSRQRKQYVHRLKGKLWRECWVMKITLFQECLRYS